MPETPGALVPAIDWAALEQLAAFFASLAPLAPAPTDAVVDPAVPAQPAAALVEELLP